MAQERPGSKPEDTQTQDRFGLQAALCQGE